MNWESCLFILFYGLLCFGIFIRKKSIWLHVILTPTAFVLQVALFMWVANRVAFSPVREVPEGLFLKMLILHNLFGALAILFGIPSCISGGMLFVCSIGSFKQKVRHWHRICAWSTLIFMTFSLVCALLLGPIAAASK